MKIVSERKIVAIAVAVFVAITTITHGVAARSPQRVLNGGTAVKTQLKIKGVVQGPELALAPTTCFYIAGGVFTFMVGYYAYNGIGPGPQESTIDQVNVVRMGPGPPFKPLAPPSTVDLVQDLP
jgi:hypothetical protein